MNISVVLCTFNRCLSLSTTLDSLAGQIVAESISWEVIIVDNNSRDKTRAVSEEYARRYPGRFRYIFEAEQGLSRARNTGIRHAKGEIIAFIDDDVVADPDWLRNLTASLVHGKWSGSGGRILPPADFRPPEWLTLGGELDLGGPLALFDLGQEQGELRRAPYGTNMAFRASMFKTYGAFRVDLGRCGQSLLSGEDTEFGDRLLRAGEQLRYSPDAVVYHPVPRERLDEKHFRSWWFDFGRTRIIERSTRPPVCGLPHEYLSIVNLLWYFLPLRTLKWLFAIKPRSRFYKKCQVWVALGELVQNYRQAKARKRASPEMQFKTP